MANNSHNSAFLLISLILFSAANPFSHAIRSLLPPIPLIGGLLPPIPQILPPIPQILPPIPLLPSLTNGTLVTGSLCCTPTGACTNGSVPIAGSVVTVICTTLTGGRVSVGQNTTNANGNFTILLPTRVLTGLIPGLFPCNVMIPNINQTLCPLFNATNTTLVGTVGGITTIGNFLSILIAAFFPQATAGVGVGA